MDIDWYMAWEAERSRRRQIEEDAKRQLEEWGVQNLCLGNIDVKSKGHIMFLEEYEYFFALRNGHHVLRAMRLKTIEQSGQRCMPQYEIFDIPFCLDMDLLDPKSSCPLELVHYVVTHPEEVCLAHREVSTIDSYFPNLLARAARSMRHPDLGLEEQEHLELFDLLQEEMDL